MFSEWDRGNAYAEEQGRQGVSCNRPLHSVIGMCTCPSVVLTEMFRLPFWKEGLYFFLEKFHGFQ